MKRAWSYVQEFMIFKLIYPILLKYVDDNLIMMTKEMEKDKRENNIPKLEAEYAQLPILRFGYSILFNYLHCHLVTRGRFAQAMSRRE